MQQIEILEKNSVLMIHKMVSVEWEVLVKFVDEENDRPKW